MQKKRANENQDGKKHLFEFGNADELKLYSIGSQEEMLNFVKLMQEMQKEFAKNQNILSGVRDDI